MTSSVFFKFKSQKDPQRVEFDGTGISVFELKRDIIIKSGLGDGKDFDLVIYTEDGKEEYDDDTTIIPRATSVMARRMPPMKPGAGRAARYMLGKMPLNIKNASRKEVANKLDTKAKPATANLSQLVTENMTEEQKMAAMFQAQSESWNATQEEMANQTRVTFGKKNHANVNVPEHDPPPGYICYRCQQKGHWIQVCPTNDDPNFDSRPKIKRTTGIPKSFLKTVEKPAALTNDGTMDDTKGPSGVMMTQDGESVVWEPDAKAWQKFQAKTKSSTAAQEATALEDKELKERGLECPLDKRQFLDPMKTPCCEKTYCNDCITNALIDSDFVCPGCQTDGCLIDDLIPDTETSKKIDAYLVEKEKAKIERARSKSPSVKPETPPSEAAKDASKTVSPESKSKSPSPIQDEVKSKSKSPIPETAPTQSKKRPAEDVLQNTPKIPKGPKAMQQQEAQKALVAQQQAMMNGMNGMNSMNGMNGMNGMPFPMMPGFGGNGFGGMPMMPGFPMGMANPMMMPMMPNMNSFGGFPTMNSMNFNGGGFQGGMGNMGMMNNMGRGGGNMNGGATGGFTNQQKSVFAEPLQNEEDNAYFRQPVNPHRHQGRQRRTRPSDFREV